MFFNGLLEQELIYWVLIHDGDLLEFFSFFPDELKWIAAGRIANDESCLLVIRILKQDGIFSQVN